MIITTKIPSHRVALVIPGIHAVCDGSRRSVAGRVGPHVLQREGRGEIAHRAKGSSHGPHERDGGGDETGPGHNPVQEGGGRAGTY